MANWSSGGVPGAWSDHYYETSAEFEAFFDGWLREAFRILKPGAHLAFFGCIKLSDVYIRIAKAVGFVYKDTIIWRYPPTFSRGKSLQAISHLESDRTRRSTLPQAYEPIFLCQKPWQTARYFPSLESNYATHGTGFIDTALLRSNILECPKPSAAERTGNPHYSVKPIEVMRILVEGLTSPNALVIDPFAGSGTTLVVCQTAHRRCIGIELEPEFVAFARHRLQ